MRQLLIGLCLMAYILCGCSANSEWTLDRAIPRVLTPTEQLAFVRTTWVNGKLRQTTFLDKQDRVLEDFFYGRTNEKVLNQYRGNNTVQTIHHYHSDSSPSGYVTIDTIRRVFNKSGLVTRVVSQQTEINGLKGGRLVSSSASDYTYIGTNDTLIRRFPVPEPNPSTVENIDRWERNKQGQLVRNFRLYIMKMPKEAVLDTIYYYSRRFSYDKFGQRKLAWFDLMYLGRFYTPAGPDTVRYFYNKRNRLVREVQQYTIDRRNKVEIDTTKLKSFDRKSVADYKRRFFEGESTYYSPNNKKTDIVEYRYERFDASKHLPLRVSQDLGY